MTQPLIQEAQLDPSIELGGGGAGGAPPDFEVAVLGSPTSVYTATIISATKPAGGSPPANVTGVLVYINGIQQSEGLGSPSGNFTYDYGAQTVNFNLGSIPSIGDTIALYAVSGVSGVTSGGPARFEVGTFVAAGSPTLTYKATAVNAVDPGGSANTSIQVFLNGLQQAEDVDFTYDYALDRVTFIGSPAPSDGAQVTLNTVGGSVFTSLVSSGEGIGIGTGSPRVVSLDFSNLGGSPVTIDRVTDLLAYYDDSAGLHKTQTFDQLSRNIWEEGTFSATAPVGWGSPIPAFDFHYQKLNGVVVLTLRSSSSVAVSTGTVFTFDGLPAAIQPSGFGSPAVIHSTMGACVDSSGFRPACMQITGSAVTMRPGLSSGSSLWTAAGNKGFQRGATFTYNINID